MKKLDYTKFNEQNLDEIIKVLELNFENTLNQNVLTFDVMKFMKITNQLANLFSDMQLPNRISCSYVNTKFEYATDLYKTKPFHVRSAIDRKTTALFDVNIVELNSLYPSIYAKAFETGELDVELRNFNKIYVWLFDNRGLIKTKSLNAYYTAKYILNSFYGVLMSTKRIVRSTATECLITKFFAEQVLPHVYHLGLYYWNVDEFIYRADYTDNVTKMLDMICSRNSRLSHETEFKSILHIDEHRRLQRFLNFHS